MPNDNGHREADGRYAYDNLGRLITAASGMDQFITFGYDALGRKTSEANSYYGTTTSAYDLAGRRTSLTHQDGFVVRYDHFVTGEMKSIADGATGAPLATFAYDERGRRTLLTRGNGTTTTYAYDLSSRLRDLGHDLTGTSHDHAMTFAYNPAAQIAETGRSNDLYAATPGVVDIASAVDGLNRLTSVGGSTVTYDARGNLTASGGRTFSYTAENRLAGAATPSGSTRLAYDPLGRLFHMNGSGSDFL